MDPDDIGAQQWQVADEDRSASSPRKGPCDDYWFIPVYVERHVLIDQLGDIQKDTKVQLRYNREFERIEMWGDLKDTRKAKMSLDRLANHFQEKHELKQKSRRTKGWAKPDRELTDVEKKKKKKQDEAEKERTRFLGRPNVECAFVHRIKWPLERPPYFWLQPDLQLLDSLRAECQAFIWLEQEKVIYVAGDDKDTTFTAMYRIKNILFKLLTPVIDEVYHVLETPSKLVEITMETTPPARGFLELEDSNQDSNIPVVFIRGKELAGFGNLVDFDLRMASFDNMETGSTAQDKTATLKYTESMTERNNARIRQLLKNSLNNIQLWKAEIKMRIRLGQVGLVEYPKPKVWSVRELDESVIVDPRLKSKFSPYFTPSPEIHRALVKRFEPRDLYENSIKTEVHWNLGVLRKSEGDRYDDIDLEVTFSEDGSISLWNALVQRTTPLDIRVISSEKRHSWAWTITTAKQLNIDKFSPEGDFVHKLHLNEEGKLVFSNTMEVQLRYIRRVKTTLFVNDPWTTELVEERFWTLKKPHKPHEYVTLTREEDQKLYSVSMFRDSWKTRFSENPHLTIGKLPTWDYTEFVDGAESIQRTMDAIEEVRAKMESLY